MKDPLKKTHPNSRRTLDKPMGKSNAPKTNRREQKRECKKRSQKEKRMIKHAISEEFRSRKHLDEISRIASGFSIQSIRNLNFESVR